MRPLTAFAIFMTAITLGLMGLCYAVYQTEQLRLTAVTAERLEIIERKCGYAWPLKGTYYKLCVEDNS